MCSTVLGRQCIGRAPRRQGAGAVPHAARQRELIGGPQPPAYVFLLAQFTLQFVQAASRKPAPSTDFRWPVSIVGGAPPPAGAPGEPGGAAKAREARRGCSGGRSRPAQAAVTGAAAAAPCPRGPRWGARSCQTTRPCCTATTMASTRCGCRPTAPSPWRAATGAWGTRRRRAAPAPAVGRRVPLPSTPPLHSHLLVLLPHDPRHPLQVPGRLPADQAAVQGQGQHAIPRHRPALGRHAGAQGLHQAPPVRAQLVPGGAR